MCGQQSIESWPWARFDEVGAPMPGMIGGSNHAVLET